MIGDGVNTYSDMTVFGGGVVEGGRPLEGSVFISVSLVVGVSERKTGAALPRRPSGFRLRGYRSPEAAAVQACGRVALSRRRLAVGVASAM